jgi:hypothetical protein
MQQPPPPAAAAAAVAGLSTGVRGQQHQPEEGGIEHTTAAGDAGDGRNSSAALSLTGYPMPLSLEALAGGSSGWCCGCVQVQQQEQSCWVRFNLPEALKQDSSIVEAADQGLLVSLIKQAS